LALGTRRPAWEGTPEQTTIYIAETFENSGQLLGRFSNEQLNQGFWFLLNNICSDFMLPLADSKFPLSLQHRVLRSFVPLFEETMAPQCSPCLSHLDEPGTNALNSACYMWWDILPIDRCPKEPARAEFDSEVLVVLKRLLAIPHDACRESALHGLGHWTHYYPRVADIIDNFLSQTPNLRPELTAYALSAKAGVL
jgi:hypothetical protein